MAAKQRRIVVLAEAVGRALLARRMFLATAESCTAGGVAYAVTQVAGSSQWFDRGFVTYSNAAKRQVLGVSATELRLYGAVSEVVARAMARGALWFKSSRIANSSMPKSTVLLALATPIRLLKSFSASGV